MPPAEPPEVRILGIDPGTQRTGFGLISTRGDRLRVVEFGAVTAPRDADLAQRLAAIYQRLREVIEQGRPDEVAVEGLFHARNARSALLLGHARGVALLAGAVAGLPVFEYAPQEVKKAVVGTGRAEKPQVQAMVCLLLAQTRPIRPLDASDALAVAICHAHSRRLRSLSEQVTTRRLAPVT